MSSPEFRVCAIMGGGNAVAMIVERDRVADGSSSGAV
jgi:hypothetical protein